MSDSPRQEQEIRPPNPLERAGARPEMRIGDPLPPKYLDVLKRLKPDIPMAWRTKAFEAAYYVHSFNTNIPLVASDGTNLENKKRKFAQQLARTGFFQDVIYKQKRDAEWAGSLPAWLVQNHIPYHMGTPEKYEALEDFWFNDLGARGRVSGEYINFDNIQTQMRKVPLLVSQFNRGKVYLEGMSGIAKEGLSDIEALKTLFETLRREDVHPYQMKMYEDEMMVLYFPKVSGDEGRRIGDIFEDCNIPIRGPAQDKRYAILDEKGEWDIARVDSNDNSLTSISVPLVNGKYTSSYGEKSSYKWEEKEYRPEVLLNQWLILAYQAYKNPASPYMLGFIPVNSKNPDSIPEEREVELLEARRQTQLSPFYFTDMYTPLNEVA